MAPFLASVNSWHEVLNRLFTILLHAMFDDKENRNSFPRLGTLLHTAAC
jgi:hypothetical protein